MERQRGLNAGWLEEGELLCQGNEGKVEEVERRMGRRGL